MPASPLLLGLKRRLEKRQREDSSIYRAFTTDFDEVIDEDDLSEMYGKLLDTEKASLEAAAAQYGQSFSKERVALAEDGAAVVREITESISEKDRSRAVVSFLIDHSGSMKGIRMISALLAVEIAVDVLRNSQIASEILGFTTATWRGGSSRKAWQWAGMPDNPGRVCDLRHIIYSSANRSPSFPWHMRMALLPDFLKENIDGEALEWAASRLSPLDWDKRVIIHISDGAPIDDATLIANDDGLLWKHLEEVRGSLTSEGVVLGTMLLGGENVPEPSLFERADEPLAAARKLLLLLQRALLPRRN